MFEKASKNKIRFTTTKGLVTTEDLWDLPLTSKNGVNLDDIAKDLHRKIKEEDTESFVLKVKKSNDDLQLKFNIVRRVIEVRLAEADKADRIKATKARNQKIMSIIADKEDASLLNKDISELRAMLEDAGDEE